MHRLALLVCLLPLAACSEEPTLLQAYLAEEWRIDTVNGAKFGAEGSIDFSVPGQVSGRSPCNQWSAVQTADLPDMAIGQMTMTEMACDDLALEAPFLAELAAMTRAVIEGADQHLVLSAPDGRRMVFYRPGF